MALSPDDTSAQSAQFLNGRSSADGLRPSQMLVRALDAPEPLDDASALPTKSRAVLSREQILDATEQSLREDGYDKTTIRSIARRLQCAVGSIYRYFDDKRDLLDAVTQRRFEPVALRIELRSPMERTMDAYVQAAREAPEQYRLMYWLSSIGVRDQSPAVPTVVRRIIDGWAAQLHDENRAWRIWAELHGSIMIGIEEQKMRQVLAELSIATLPLVAEVSTRGATQGGDAVPYATPQAEAFEQTASPGVGGTSRDRLV